MWENDFGGLTDREVEQKRTYCPSILLQELGGSAPCDQHPILAAFIAQVLRDTISLLDTTVTKHFQGCCNAVTSKEDCFDVLRPLSQQLCSVLLLINLRYTFLNARHYKLMIN